MNLSNYNINFSNTNPNVIEFWENGKMIHHIICPPVTNGCDIIGFGEEIHTGFQHKFDGLVIMTKTFNNMVYRTIYHRGILVAENNKLKKD